MPIYNVVFAVSYEITATDEDSALEHAEELFALDLNEGYENHKTIPTFFGTHVEEKET